MAKGVAICPVLRKECTSRGQVDLVDMQSMPGNNCKWIMVYQDHLMKFYVLRPIKTRHPTEVAAQLTDLSFSFLCALVILQSNNSTYFTAHVILKT